MVTVRAWPRCSSPVTLGGGIMMQNGCFWGSLLGTKWPLSSQNWYREPSTLEGS